MDRQFVNSVNPDIRLMYHLEHGGKYSRDLFPLENKIMMSVNIITKSFFFLIEFLILFFDVDVKITYLLETDIHFFLKGIKLYLMKHFL
jgi:hypothetical protein